MNYLDLNILAEKAVRDAKEALATYIVDQIGIYRAIKN